jgi:predicted ATPase
LHFASMVHQLRRDPEKARNFSVRCSTIAVENGFSFWMAGSAVLRGWAVAADGAMDEGIALMRKGLADWEATGALTYRTYFLGILAESVLRRGDVSEACRLLDEAIALADRTGEDLISAELHRLRGEALLRSPNPLATADRAFAEFLRALRLASEQQAKSLQLRAASSIVRHMEKRRSNAADSQKLLSRIRSQFAEGLFTPGRIYAKPTPC